MSVLEYNGEKYLVISDGNEDYRCYFFEDLTKLQEWLDEGSFDEGTWLFEVSNPRRLEYTTTRAFEPVIVGGEKG